MADELEDATAQWGGEAKYGSSSPLPPVPDYEPITIRELSIGFAGGSQDMTLYPEDTMEVDGRGNIKVVFVTMNGGEFVAYEGKTEWHSLKLTPHRRKRGTLRPSPEEVMRDFRQRQAQERAERTAKLLRERE